MFGEEDSTYLDDGTTESNTPEEERDEIHAALQSLVMRYPDHDIQSIAKPGTKIQPIKHVYSDEIPLF